MTTNVCFAGDDMQSAYITMSASGCLGKVRWPRKGLRLAF
jgi:gluconolactonase